MLSLNIFTDCAMAPTSSPRPSAAIEVDMSPSAILRIAAVIALIGLAMLRHKSQNKPPTSTSASPAIIPIWRTCAQKIVEMSSR
jgi:hypothetical protein